MALPTNFDEFFLVGITLTFLMVNFNLDLSSVYSNMAIWMVIGYLVPLIFNLFEFVPFRDKKRSLLSSIGLGAAVGVAFIWVYNNLLQTTTPLAQVFATTAFGESELLGKFVFSGLIPFIETPFFFWILPSWFAWKIGTSLKVPLFSTSGIIIVIFFAAVFTMFHATAFGVENNTDLISTFIFGAISLGLVLHFKQVVEAFIMHVVVNGFGVGFLDTLRGIATNGVFVGNQLFIYFAIGGIALWLWKTGKLKQII